MAAVVRLVPKDLEAHFSRSRFFDQAVPAQMIDYTVTPSGAILALTTDQMGRPRIWKKAMAGETTSDRTRWGWWDPITPLLRRCTGPRDPDARKKWWTFVRFERLLANDKEILLEDETGCLWLVRQGQIVLLSRQHRT